MSWAWWDWPWTWLTNHCPSVQCWLSHLTRKIISKMTYNVSCTTVNPSIHTYIGRDTVCVICLLGIQLTWRCVGSQTDRRHPASVCRRTASHPATSMSAVVSAADRETRHGCQPRLCLYARRWKLHQNEEPSTGNIWNWNWYFGKSFCQILLPLPFSVFYACFYNNGS